MPETFTDMPTFGDVCAAPWTSWMKIGGEMVENDQAAFCAIVSGGSIVS